MSKPDTSSSARILQAGVESGDVPGVVAAAATADGAIFEGGYGKRDLNTGEAMDADTVVWIASMTKAVTGACAMQLVEQGKLSLDAPIAAVLPDLGKVRVLEGVDGSGQPKFRDPKRPITLRHLLTHTSGYVYEIWNADMGSYMEKHGIPGIISCLNAALTVPLMFDPGERWEYGIGIDWCGKAVEAASGMKLGSYMRENLLDPLGMNDTSFEISPSQRRRLAKIHARTPDGFVSTDTEIPQQPEFEMGGAGLYSTATDYLKFAQMILHDGTFNGERILKPETVALMSKSAIGDVNVRPLKTAAPPFSNDLNFIDGMKWGLTFLINPEPLPTGRSEGSLAWAGLANSYYWIDKKKQVAGVYATQILPFFDSKSVELFAAFETSIYRAL